MTVPAGSPPIPHRLLRALRGGLLALSACLFALCSAGCSNQEPDSARKPDDAQPPRVVRVAAASDLRNALERIGAELERTHPGVTLQATYGSSGNLFSQLKSRAPYDVFLSADTAYPAQLVADGLTASKVPFVYARGHLVLCVAKESKLPIEDRGLSALEGEDARRIAIANPAHAPYGRAAEAALRAAGLWDAIQPKLAIAESASQAAQYCDSGAADAGLIPLSLAMAPPMLDKMRYVPIDGSLYPPLDQAGVILASAADKESAEAFVALMQSAAGRAILDKYGFERPAE